MQSNLEKEGLSNRSREFGYNTYEKTEEYSSSHKDALSDGDVNGKGTGVGGHLATVPDFRKSPTSMSNQIDTTAGGGKYDIEGGPGELDGNSGRNYLQTMNTYSPGEEFEYSANHKNAKSDGDVQGKGYGSGYDHYVPDYRESHTSPNYRLGIKTDGGGGKYDIEGRPDLANTGRNGLTKINLYGPGREYGSGDYDVNTDKNKAEGQYFQKIKI